MKPIQTAFTTFQNYIYEPYYHYPLTGLLSKSTTARQFLREYPLLFIILLISIGTIYLTEYVTGQNVFTSISPSLRSSVVVWAIGVPLAVMLNEFVFRAILLLTPYRLRIVATFLVLMLISYGYRPVKEIGGTTAGIGLIIIWGVGANWLDSYLKRPAIFTRIHLFWQTNFRQVFYAIAVLYALNKTVDHISTLTHWQLLLSPILLLTSLVNGLYFGYVRMTYGFWYAVAVHVLLLLTSLAPVIHIL